jgi:chromatin segregation and condensation protein Rec8/ScpA/Scc1 (kleisin family)
MFEKLFYKGAEDIEILRKPVIHQIFPSDIIYDTYLRIFEKNQRKVNINSKIVNLLAVSEKVTVRSKIKEILKQLFKKTKFTFSKLFNIKKVSKIEVVTAFQALLELSKANKVNIEQQHLFEDIVVIKRDKSA